MADSTPPPGTEPGVIPASVLAQLNAAVSGGGSGKTTFDNNLYGLPNQLANVTLNLGGLLPGQGDQMTALSLLQAMSGAMAGKGGMDPSNVALIQTLLFSASGYYPPGYSPSGNLGTPMAQDLKAFGRFLASAANSTLAAQAQHGGAPDLNTLLNSQAQTGQAAASAQDLRAQWLQAAAVDAKPVVVHTPDPAAVADDATRAYQAVLGRKPNPAELNAFVASFSASFVGAQYDRGAAREQVQYDYRMAEASQKALGQQSPAFSARDFANPPNRQPSDTRANRTLTPTPDELRGTPTDPTAVIVSVARSLGVDPRLALAIAQHESGLDPTVAIMDHHPDGTPAGMSVGLYQLNDNGEGAGMSIAERQNPYTNARIALQVVASVARAHPDWSPGQIAAAAQRPGDPQGYASIVNSIYASNRFEVTPPSRQELTMAAANMSLPPPPNPSEIVTPGTPDVNADALAAARKNHPVEAGAHDIADTFGMFLDLIGGKLGASGPGGNQPSPVPPG